MEIQVRVSSGRFEFSGNGRDLAEALLYLGRTIESSSDIPLEVLADLDHALNGLPFFTAEVTSQVTWWKPWTWGTLQVELSQRRSTFADGDHR